MVSCISDLSTLVDSSALMSDLKSINRSNSVLPDSRPCTVQAVVNKTDTTDDNHVEFVVICSIDSSDNPSGQAETLEDSDGLPFKPNLQAGLPYTVNQSNTAAMNQTDQQMI